MWSYFWQELFLELKWLFRVIILKQFRNDCFSSANVTVDAKMDQYFVFIYHIESFA